MKHLNADIFSYRNYRDYMQKVLPKKGEGRGARTHLARALGCQNGFITQVLSGLADFSMEHAIRISWFLKHTKEERDFFLLLVQLSRSGTNELKKYFSEKIEKKISRRRSVSNRLQSTERKWNEADKILYYSSWHYAAVHMCLVIPSLQTNHAVVNYLRLPVERVAEILSDLQSMGLATRKEDRFFGNYDRIHLPAESPLVAKHHTNWRMRAIQALDHIRASDLHYSLVMSISSSAAEQIRKLILDTIDSLEPVIKEAKDEEVHVFTLDLFRLKN